MVREEEEDDDVLGEGVKRERKLEVADWRKWEMGSVGDAMGSDSLHTVWIFFFIFGIFVVSED